MKINTVCGKICPNKENLVDIIKYVILEARRLWFETRFAIVSVSWKFKFWQFPTLRTIFKDDSSNESLLTNTDLSVGEHFCCHDLAKYPRFVALFTEGWYFNSDWIIDNPHSHLQLLQSSPILSHHQHLIHTPAKHVTHTKAASYYPV